MMVMMMVVGLLSPQRQLPVFVLVVVVVAPAFASSFAVFSPAAASAAASCTPLVPVDSIPQLLGGTFHRSPVIFHSTAGMCGQHETVIASSFPTMHQIHHLVESQ